MAIGAAIAALGSVGGSLFNTLYTMNRNRTVDERDDTAIQRRVKDLEAAGLNPLLAAGNGANTTVGMSTNLDTSGVGNFVQTMYDLKNQRETYKQNQLATHLMENELNRSNLDNYVYNQMVAAETGMYNSAIVSNRNYNYNYSPFGKLNPSMQRIESQIGGKTVQSWSNPQFKFDSSSIADQQQFYKWFDSIKNQTTQGYRQSLFDLRTQDYQNYLNLVTGTLNPLLDLGGMFKGTKWNPWTTRKTFTK